MTSAVEAKGWKANVENIEGQKALKVKKNPLQKPGEASGSEKP
jgi:hypothetical protein